VVGTVQSYRLLRKLKPDVIFVKGGFVGVPVGLAAARLRIPFVTHDSDAIPGLANRIISRWATVHAIALPKEVYSYPASKMVTVGVPVQSEFIPVTAQLQQEYKQQIGLDQYGKVLLVTGGGLGAKRLNDMVLQAVPQLLERYSDLAIIHTVGRAHAAEMNTAYEKALTPAQRSHVLVKGYVTDMYRYSGAADVIITRAGATTLAEFAVQAKACIVVPNPLLTGGHQTKNAAYLAEQHAVRCLAEDELQKNPELLTNAVERLLGNAEERLALGTSLSKFAHPTAAKELAMVLLEQAHNTNKQDIAHEVSTKTPTES